MDDPAHDQRESLSQPKEFSRTPTWAITDWDEPESKAATAPPKFSIRDFRALANIGLAICLLVSAFVLFGDAVDSPFQRGHRTGVAWFIVLVCIALGLFANGISTRK